MVIHRLHRARTAPGLTCNPCLAHFDFRNSECSRRRCQHCGILWFIFLTKKNESLTVEEMFVRVTHEKRTFLPQRRFSFVLLIICDNLIFIVFFNIKFNQPIKQKYIMLLLIH